MMRGDERMPDNVPPFADRVLLTDLTVHQQDIFGAFGIERGHERHEVEVYRLRRRMNRRREVEHRLARSGDHCFDCHGPHGAAIVWLAGSGSASRYRDDHGHLDRRTRGAAE